MEQAGGDLVCILHADSLLPPDAITHIRRVLADRRIALATFLLMRSAGMSANQFNRAGLAGDVFAAGARLALNAPGPLLDAIAKGDFGSTADAELGTQTVNFMTNLDTTGGNSGSPVLDAQGKLIGLNFDSNWEAVSASWMFDPRYKRAIHVDMRYLRWLLAKVYPAPNVLQEMQLPAE